MKKGLFITLEGIEGVGKTTQIKSLQLALRNDAIEFIGTREPGGTPTAEIIRNIILKEEMNELTELLMYSASRAEHVASLIRPNLQAGIHVLCDRFTDATIAYQGYGRGLDIKLIENLNRIATAGLKPDITIIIDLPVETAFQRLAKRGSEPDRFEKLNHDFYTRVREGYLNICKNDPDRVALVDGNRDEASIHREIADIVMARVKQ
jgi:dTMP kinase